MSIILTTYRAVISFSKTSLSLTSRLTEFTITELSEPLASMVSLSGFLSPFSQRTKINAQGGT